MRRVKILLLSLVLLLMAAISTVYASDQDFMVVDDNQTTAVNESALSLALAGEPTGELTNLEREGLLYMVEEEKLADDVYSALNDKWNLRVFDNIGRAELTHEDAVQTLLERYSLTNPIRSTGEFSNAILQRLYDDLVNRGDLSVEDALKVGVFVTLRTPYVISMILDLTPELLNILRSSSTSWYLSLFSDPMKEYSI